MKVILILCLALCLCSCTYLKYAGVQAEYARIQNAEPGQLNVKHMIDREKIVVIGQCNDDEGNYTGMPKAIAAFSSKYRPNEWVETMYFEAAGSHYGMSLPEGQYKLLVFADIDGDGVFGRSEVVGQRTIDLDKFVVPEMVLGQVDIQLTSPSTIAWSIAIDVPDTQGRAESLFYPAGTLRKLNDPIFDAGFSTLGLYDPASFLEQAPTMFYALEDDLGYKIPVIYVHGIAGSAREFETFVGQLDRLRYKPWFFHYPSGGDLDQLAELFYQIFLSGKVYNSKGMPIIVIAHSMGGLIVREAINKYEENSRENEIHLFVTIATPFGGHAAAAKGEEHGLLVLPSWRDLNPENAFIGNLYRQPLPDFVHHELIYAYQNPGTIKLGENNDGVVALNSQLKPQVQIQASGQFGFDNTHTDILDSTEVAAHIRARMDQVENPVPLPRLQVLYQGGYDVVLGDTYSPEAQYLIHNVGIYLMALTEGTFLPFYPEEDRFMSVVNGEKPPVSDAEKGWLRFLSEYPKYRTAEPD
jgi:triacylglycerol esterase/lipase EstA (alpha/beta hydrolase family)